jgi:hypothetical protein
MVNVAGYELKVPAINVAGVMQSVAIWTVSVIVIVALIAWAVIAIKNKKTYVTPITLRVRRANGLKSRYDLMGGVVQGRNGIRDFMIKIPGVAKKKSLGYIPDFSLADSSDRISFLQEGDSTNWQQIREELVQDRLVEYEDTEGKKSYYTEKLLLEPIPTDTKTTTYNNMQQTRDLLDLKKMTAFGITIIGFIIMVVAHLISLYIQTKIRCGTP